MSTAEKIQIDDEDVKVVVARSLGSDVEIVDHWIELYSKVKCGILSSHYELIVNVKWKSDEEIQKHTFFVKTADALKLGSNDPLYADDITFMEEVNFFNEIYPVMKKCTKGEPCLAKCWLAKKNMLIFEDLRAQGYSMSEELFFDQNRLSIAISILAKFHASIILSEAYLGKPLNEAYPNAFREKIFSSDSQLYSSMNVTVETVSLLADYFGLPLASNDKVKNWLLEAVKTSNSKLNVVCHGDVWRNNFMMNNDKYILVDYQLLRYCSPGIDLVMFMYLNSTPQLRKSSEREMIQLYYKTLTETLERTDLNPKIPSFQDIWTAYESKKFVGAFYAAMYLPGLLLPSEILHEMFTNATKFDRYLLENRIEVILPEIKRDPTYADKMREITDEYVIQAKKALG